MLHLLKYIPVTVMEERYVMLILTIEDQTVVDRKGFKSSEFGLFTSLHVFDMERPSSSNRTIAQFMTSWLGVVVAWGLQIQRSAYQAQLNDKQDREAMNVIFHH